MKPGSPHESNGEKGDATVGPTLPRGWCWTTLGEIATVGTGTTPSRTNPQHWNSGTIAWITSKPRNLRTGGLERWQFIYSRGQLPRRLVRSSTFAIAGCGVEAVEVLFGGHDYRSRASNGHLNARRLRPYVVTIRSLPGKAADNMSQHRYVVVHCVGVALA